MMGSQGGGMPPGGGGMEAQALQAALGPQQGGGGMDLPPELLQIAQQLGLDINNPEDLMQLMIMMGGGGGNIPGGEPVEDEGMPPSQSANSGF